MEIVKTLDDFQINPMYFESCHCTLILIKLSFFRPDTFDFFMAAFSPN